jgi:hypothetical protein
VAAVALPLTPAAQTVWERRTSPPVADAPTSSTSKRSGPLGEPATGPVLTIQTGPVLAGSGTGSLARSRWEYIAYESGDKLCHGFRSGPGLAGGGGGCERFTEQTEPIIFSASAGRRIDGTAALRFADGPVTKAAVRVRIALAGRAAIQLQPAGPPDLPVRFFVVVLPPTAVATDVTAYDSTGRIVAHQSLAGLPTARPEPARIGAGDTGWLATMLGEAGYRTATGAHHVVTATAGGHRTLAWTTTAVAAAVQLSTTALAGEGYHTLRRSGAATVFRHSTISRVGWWAQGRLVWIEPQPEPERLDHLVDLSLRVSRTGG